MIKKYLFTLFILALLLFYQNSHGQDYKQIWVNVYSDGIEYAIYLPDFTIDNAQIIFDKYIKNFKTLCSVMKKLDDLNITFLDSDYTNEFKIYGGEFLFSLPKGTRSLFAIFEKHLDYGHLDNKIKIE